MLYILNVILPKKRNFRNSIKALYGIGNLRAQKLASILGLHPSAKIEQVSQSQLNFLGRLVEKSFLIDFELKRKIGLNISSLQKLRTIRGFCHSLGLPLRGQRTHTNASTAKLLLRKNSLQTQTKTFSFSSSQQSNKRFTRSKNNNNKIKSKKK